MTLEELTIGSIYHRVVGNRLIVVTPRIYNTIITIGPADFPAYENQW